MASPRQRARLEANRVRERIQWLEDRLDETPAGIRSTSHDGTTVQYSRMDVEKELQMLRKRLAVLTGARERGATIRLDNAY